MRLITNGSRHRSISILTLALAASALSTFPVAAQDNGLDKRVERIEKQLRAVQRTVFPGGSPEFFEGEIAPDQVPGARSTTTPVTDLTARVNAVESQLQTLTNQSEQNAFQLRELQKQFTAFKADVEKGMTAAPPAVPAPEEASAAPAKKSSAPPAAKSDASAERMAQVKAVEIPATGDEARDSYVYGYRLWEAKLYPEAEAELKKTVARWPKNDLASRAQNLLGRAYLDEGKPSLAAVAFYNNYKDRPSGDRAPHSLMYMGVALTTLGRKTDACKAFRELDEVYGDKAPEDVRADAAAAKAKAGC